MRKRNKTSSMIEQLESRTLLSVPEPNNTFATATQMGATSGFAGGNPLTNFIGDNDTVDVFKFFTSASGNLTITLKNATAALRMTLIHDVNRNGVQDKGDQQVASVVSSSTSGVTLSATLTQNLSLESYYVTIVRVLAGNTGYSLNPFY